MLETESKRCDIVLVRKTEKTRHECSWGEAVQGEYPCLARVRDKPKNPGITTNTL